LALYSTVTGEPISGQELDAGYWYRNGRQTVYFGQALQKLIADGHDVFVEVSPHPVLGLSMQETARAAGASVSVVGTLRRDQGDDARLMRSVAELHASGHALDLGRVVGEGERVALPTYAFQRERYWLDVRSA